MRPVRQPRLVMPGLTHGHVGEGREKVAPARALPLGRAMTVSSLSIPGVDSEDR